MQVRGPLLSHFQETFLVSKSLLGLIAPAGSVGFIATVLAMGMASGRVRIKKFLLLGVGIVSIFLIFTGFSTHYYLLLLFLVGTGIGSGIFRGLDRPTLNHLYPNRTGWIYNLNAAAWGAGAASGPLLASLILKFGSWRIVYYLLGLICIPLFLIMWKTELPSFKREKPLSLKGLRRIWKSAPILGMIVIIFLNGGVEGGFFIWLPYYMSGFFSENFANIVLSGFLAAYVPGRILYSRIAEKTGYTSLVIWNSAISTLLIFLALFLSSEIISVICIFSVGFFISGNFPNILSLTTGSYPQYSGPVNGLAMTSSAIGISVFPALIGVIADHYSLKTGMWTLVPLMGSVVIATVILRMKLNQKK